MSVGSLPPPPSPLPSSLLSCGGGTDLPAYLIKYSYFARRCISPQHDCCCRVCMECAVIGNCVLYATTYGQPLSASHRIPIQIFTSMYAGPPVLIPLRANRIVLAIAVACATQGVSLLLHLVCRQQIRIAVIGHVLACCGSFGALSYEAPNPGISHQPPFPPVRPAPVGGRCGSLPMLECPQAVFGDL